MVDGIVAMFFLLGGLLTKNLDFFVVAGLFEIASALYLKK